MSDIIKNSKNRSRVLPKTLFGNANARLDTHFETFAEAYGSAIGPKSGFITNELDNFFTKLLL